MSADHDIFIKTDHSEQDIVADIGAAVGVPLKKIDDETNEYIDYATTLEHAAIQVRMSHEFEEDYRIPFYRYPIKVKIKDFQRDEIRQEALAQGIFDKLCARGYQVLLVYNLARLIDRCGS